MAHTIEPIRAYCSNFMSFGNNVNEFIFEKDGTITWIKGPNGVGKSVMIEMLSFGWFGKPYRDIKKNVGVRNTSNEDSKAATIVGIEFRRIHGDAVDLYEVIRRMTKSGSVSLTIKHNGEPMTKEAGMTQQKLESVILGFDYTIFENIISLNTIQTIPIIDMPPDKKRKLLESIATIHLDKLKKINNETLKDMQIKFTSATDDVEQYTIDTADLTKILQTLKAEKKAGIEDLEKQAKTIAELINRYGDEKKAFEDELDTLKERGINKKEEFEKYDGVTDKINNYNTILTHLEYLSPLPDKIEEKHKKYQAGLNEINEFVIKLKDIEYDETEDTKVTTELKDLSKTGIDHLMNSTQLKNRLDVITKDAKALKAGEPCITCGKPSTEEDVEKIKKEYRKKYKDINTEYKAASKLLEENKTAIDKLTERKKEFSENKEKRNAIMLECKPIETTTNALFREIGDMATDKDFKEGQIKKLFNANGDDNMLSVEEVNTNITALNVQLEIRAGLKTDLDDIRIEATKKVEAIKGLRSNITTSTEQLTSLNDKIEEKKSSNIDDACAQTEKKLKDTSSDLERAHERVRKYSDEVAKCKYIQGMYADNGIKQIILQAFVPNLNKAIAHNLALFELPFSVEFDDSMEYTFTGRLGMAKEYGGLSQGQTRKLNFAITIAFRDFVSAIADFKINILFLDEVLDISTDDEALEHMLQLLKAKVTEVGQIYLMTHRGQQFENYFDNIIELEHDGRYSTINKIK